MGRQGGTERRAERGWTFVEAILVFVILAIIIVSVLSFLSHQSDFWDVSTTQTDLRTNAERAINDVARELRQARRVSPGTAPNITIPAAPNNTSITFYIPTDVDGLNGVLTADGSTVEWNTANPIQFVYDAASGQLRRAEGGVTRVLANDVTSVVFTDRTIEGTAALLSNEVRIAMTLQRATTRGRPVAASVATVVKLRN